MAEDTPRYGRGMNPESRKNLQQRKKVTQRRPTPQRYRRTRIDELKQKNGFSGSEHTIDLDMFVDCEYRLKYLKPAGAEAHRLRTLLLELSDRLQLGALSHPTSAPQIRPRRDSEHLKRVGRLLAEVGALGDEAAQMVALAEEIDAIPTHDELETDD